MISVLTPRAWPTLPGSAAMYAEGTASRPPTAKGLADIGVKENGICTLVVAQGPLSGPAAFQLFPAMRMNAFEDTCQWGLEPEAVYKEIVTSGPRKVGTWIQCGSRPEGRSLPDCRAMVES